ncbi:MAG: hypothetical protein QGI45_02775 [Myxococcota bacterium]|nr:hypothetical protein [Myxococcota bacterium]
MRQFIWGYLKTGSVVIMKEKTQEFKKQFNELWKQTITQLDDIKDVVLRSTDKLEKFDLEMERLRLERDKLLKSLGEQTLRWLEQSKDLPIPPMVRRTLNRLNVVAEGLTEKSKKAKKAKTKAPAKKKAAKKPATKKAPAKKKVAKKTAKKTTKKKTTKKTVAKKSSAA